MSILGIELRDMFGVGDMDEAIHVVACTLSPERIGSVDDPNVRADSNSAPKIVFKVILFFRELY